MKMSQICIRFLSLLIDKQMQNEGTFHEGGEMIRHGCALSKQGWYESRS